MKCLLAIILLLSVQVRAEDIEIIAGAPTYHFFDFGGDQFLHPKWTPDGRLVGTPLVGVGILHYHEDYYTSTKIFAGNNCVGQPIGGALASIGINSGAMYYGLVWGGYIQNERTFLDAGVQTTAFVDMGDYGIVPIVGGEINYRRQLSSLTYLKLNTLITPIFVNESLSLGISL